MKRILGILLALMFIAVCAEAQEYTVQENLVGPGFPKSYTITLTTPKSVPRKSYSPGYIAPSAKPIEHFYHVTPMIGDWVMILWAENNTKAYYLVKHRSAYSCVTLKKRLEQKYVWGSDLRCWLAK